MTNYAAQRADRARRCNLPVTLDEIEPLPIRSRSTATRFAEFWSRFNIERVARWTGLSVPVAANDDADTITIEAAAPRFVEWMRENGFAGHHTDKQMREFVRWWEWEAGIDPLPIDQLMKLVARSNLGAHRERVRLKSRGGPNVRVTRYTILDKISPLVIESRARAQAGKLGTGSIARAQAAKAATPRLNIAA